MNASSKEATALDGAELTAKSLNYTASRKLFCVKTGEEIPRGTYQRRDHLSPVVVVIVNNQKSQTMVV